LLIKPSTYMNNSGIAVIQAMEQFPIAVSDIVAVVDDFNIPEGVLRLREKGSAGGHNGLKSIIYHLGSEDFARLRIGIGVDNSSKDRDFVLGEFENISTLKNIVEESVSAMEKIIELGTIKAMNCVNKKKDDDTSKTGGES